MNSSNNVDISPSKHKLDDDYLKECLLKENLTNLISDPDSRNNLEIKELISELNSVALEWKSSKNLSECKCSTTFDAFNKKVN